MFFSKCTQFNLIKQIIRQAQDKSIGLTAAQDFI